MKKWVILRRTSQAVFCILFIYILWATTYPLASSIPADTFFIIDPLIIVSTSISERIILPGILFSLMLIGLTLIFGRFFCGWICPLGTTFDMLGRFKKKKNKPPQKLRYGKYVFLGIITITACAGIQTAWVGDPIVITARFVSLNLIPTVTLLINKLFIFIIQQFNLYGWFYDLYRSLKASFLGINPYYFSNSLITFLFFAVVCLPVFFIPRFWCRAVCPLGALYALCARYAMLKRFVSSCTQCGQCTGICRMGAIKPDAGYVKHECILCMDCLYDCRPRATAFGFSIKKTPRSKTGSADAHSASHISRRNFLFILGVSLFSQGFKKLNKKSSAANIIRPPGALKEPAFLNRCVRCGNCMKVCITNGLQPVFLESGLSGIWTPQLMPEIGYCEYNCTLCGQVCPTGAIPHLPVDKKRKIKLGIARIDRMICLPWAEGKECIVCEEHCPIADKAIKMIEEDQKGHILLKPYVEESLCIGCGICQNKCPVLPIRAIRINPSQADRS